MFDLSHRSSPGFMRRLARLLIVPLVALALGLHLPVAAHAAGTIVVDSLGDKQAADGRCTLREAISAASMNAPVDTCVAGAPGADIISFSISGTIVLSTRLPDISEALTIRGPGANLLTISGNNAVSILFVNPSSTLNLENVTVANATGPDSGYISGGSIESAGTLNVTNSIFSGNSSTWGGGGAILQRGGTLNVTNSTFSGNSAIDLGGAILSNGGTVNITGSTFTGNSAYHGGAIYSSGTLNVTNSTFSRNAAVLGGGGIYGWTLNVTNSTFSRNSAFWGAGIVGHGAQPILKNTIIADSTGSNCDGYWPKGTHNFVTGDTCGGSTTLTSSAALRLGPLQDNGGGTQTIVPQAGSVAIDAGDPATCAAEPVRNRDQRGEVRPQGIGCDVGAVEVKPSYYPPVAMDDSYTTVANPAQPLSVDAAHGLLPNDDDQDGDALTTLLVSEPSHGKLALNADGSFTYIPSRGFQGSDSFTYRASDGSRESNAATVTITVGIVAATADSYSTTQDTALTVDAPGVLANDAHADGKPLLAILVSGPSHGKLSLNEDGSFTYIPEEGFGKGDSFVYVASDGGRESNAATVTIAVTP